MPAEPEIVCVYEPWGPQDVALVESILMGAGISYHIENEQHARGGFAIADCRTRVMVHRSAAEEARKLLIGLRREP